MIDPTPFIRSYVPGRLRLRCGALVGLDEATLGALTSTVKSAPGICDCVINPKVGSLLLTWDAKKLTEKDLLGYLQFWAAFLPEDALVCEAKRGTAKEPVAYSDKILQGLEDLFFCKGSSFKRSRQLENRITAVFGVATLASLIKGASLHAQVGTAFTLMLAWHLWKRRRVF